MPLCTAFSWAPLVLAVSGAYITIEHLLASPKQFPLKIKFRGELQPSCQAYVTWWGSNHSMREDIVILHKWLYVHVSVSLMFWCIMKKSCGYGTVVKFSLLIWLPVVGCCYEVLHSNKIERTVNNLLTNWGTLPVNSYEGFSYGLTQFLKDSAAICVELIFALGIPRVNFEDLPLTIYKHACFNNIRQVFHAFHGLQHVDIQSLTSVPVLANQWPPAYKDVRPEIAKAPTRASFQIHSETWVN